MTNQEKLNASILLMEKSGFQVGDTIRGVKNMSETAKRDMKKRKRKQNFNKYAPLAAAGLAGGAVGVGAATVVDMANDSGEMRNLKKKEKEELKDKATKAKAMSDYKKALKATRKAKKNLKSASELAPRHQGPSKPITSVEWDKGFDVHSSKVGPQAPALLKMKSKRAPSMYMGPRDLSTPNSSTVQLRDDYKDSVQSRVSGVNYRDSWLKQLGLRKLGDKATKNRIQRDRSRAVYNGYKDHVTSKGSAPASREVFDHKINNFNGADVSRDKDRLGIK